MKPTYWAVERKLADGTVFRLGVVRLTNDGYRFLPYVCGRTPSRKGHASLEAALPRWVGYPDRCETHAL